MVALETVSGSLAMPFLIMRRLAGSALIESSSALIEAGRQLRLAHTVDLPGYGALQVSGSGAVGEYGSWPAFINDVTSGLEDLVAGEVVTDDLTARASETIAVSDALYCHQRAVLLHGDLKLEHVFADSDGYVGIIDWGDACAGDPRLDLGRMSMAGGTALRAFLSGYGLPVTAELSRAFTAYRLVWNLDAMLYEYRAGGDWFDCYRDGAESAIISCSSLVSGV